MRTPHLVSAAACVLVVTAGSAAASTPVEPLPLDAVVDAVTQTAAEPSRFELHIAGDVPDLPLPEGGTTIASGAIDGSSFDVDIDLTSLLEASGAPADFDGTMEATITPDGIYFRVPLLGLFAELVPAASGEDNPLSVLTELGDGWGYIDLAALSEAAGVDPETLTTTLNPAELLRGLESATKLSALGTDTIGGVAATGVRLNVNLGRLIESMGIDELAELAEMDETELAELEQLSTLTIPIDAWIGDDGYLHRVEVTLDAETFADMGEMAPEMGDIEAIEDLSLTVTLDFFDFGAADIAIEPPAEFTDVTDVLLELAELADTVTPATIPAEPAPATEG